MLMLYSNFLFCQIEDYYYYNQEKRSIEISTNYLYIAVKAEYSKQGFDLIKTLTNYNVTAAIVNSGHQTNLQEFDWFIVHFINSLDSPTYNSLISALSQDSHLMAIEPVIGDEAPIAVSNIFYVKLKQINDFDILRKMSAEMNINILHQDAYMPQWYYLSTNVKSNGNTIDVAKKLMESGQFEAIDPGFMFNFKENTCTSTEPLFSQQWGLSNSSGPDIDVCDVWPVTTGSLNINVAVLDEGIDLNHQEFTSHINNSFDLISNSTPSNIYGDHATHVAGIIGAEVNGIQISGVAPNTGLMSISDPLTATPTISSELATGFGWAVTNGADIISCSWGDQGGALHTQLQSSMLDNAITNALTNGRGGLGTVVVFAAGNFNTVMDYPANSNPDLITVGSIDQSGSRSSFSGHASQLDVVAPGGNILSTLPNNSTGFKSGTSMATPHVSGVAALMLSVNPCLSRQNIHDIICQTAQKINSSTMTYGTTSAHTLGSWNDELGYGLVDANAAVQMASNAFLQHFTETSSVVRASFLSLQAGFDVTTFISPGDYEVSNTANVEIKSPLSITFKPGFVADPGSVMLAHIVPFANDCPNWPFEPVSFKTGQEPLVIDNVPQNDSGLSLGVSIYPNPFSRDITFGFGVLDKGTRVSIQISDMTGRLVYQSNAEYETGNQKVIVPLSVTPAMYVATVCIGNNCATKKLVKYALD